MKRLFIWGGIGFAVSTAVLGIAGVAGGIHVKKAAEEFFGKWFKKPEPGSQIPATT